MSCRCTASQGKIHQIDIASRRQRMGRSAKRFFLNTDLQCSNRLSSNHLYRAFVDRNPKMSTTRRIRWADSIQASSTIKEQGNTHTKRVLRAEGDTFARFPDAQRDTPTKARSKQILPSAGHTQNTQTDTPVQMRSKQAFKAAEDAFCLTPGMQQDTPSKIRSGMKLKTEGDALIRASSEQENIAPLALYQHDNCKGYEGKCLSKQAITSPLAQSHQGTGTKGSARDGNLQIWPQALRTHLELDMHQQASVPGVDSVSRMKQPSRPYGTGTTAYFRTQTGSQGAESISDDQPTISDPYFPHGGQWDFFSVDQPPSIGNAATTLPRIHEQSGLEGEHLFSDMQMSSADVISLGLAVWKSERMHHHRLRRKDEAVSRIR